MQAGSLVETIGDFTKERLQWKFSYPQKGDILTISAIEEHPDAYCRNKGIMLLYFEELPEMFGISDKTVDDTPNFIELLPPANIEELLSEPIKKLTRLSLLVQNATYSLFR